MKTYMNSKKFSVMLLFVIIMLCTFLPSIAYAKSDDTILLNNGWMYSFEDVALNHSSSTIDWTEIENVKTGVKNPQKETSIWMKVKLPAGDWVSPSIYFESFIGKSFEMYIDGQKIFEKTRTQNYSNNKLVVPIHSSDLNKELLIKIYFSKTTLTVGPQSSVYLGEHSTLITALVKNGYFDSIMGSAFIFLSFVMLFCSIYLKGIPRKSWISLSLIIFFIGSMMLTFLSNIFLVYPDLDEYINLIFGISLFSTFTLLTYYFIQIFGFGYKKMISKMFHIQVIYSVFCLIILFLNKPLNYRLDSIVFLFCSQVMSIFLVIVLLVLISTAVYYTYIGNKEARTFTIGFFVFSATIIFDSFHLFLTSQLNFIMWKWGVLFFILAITSILGRRFALDHKNVIAYSKELEHKNNALSDLWKEVTASRDEISRWNSELEKIVANRTFSISNLLNNAGQGFLYFSKDLLVKPEYSTVCSIIFNDEIARKNICDLIYPNSEHSAASMTEILNSIMLEHDEYRRNVFLSLLPEEFKTDDKFIKIEYKIIPYSNDDDTHINGKNKDIMIMMILTDITNNKHYENQIEQERNILKMVVNIVVYLDDFNACVFDYNKFCDIIINQLFTDAISFTTAYSEVTRQLHTFKGNFAQYGMKNLVRKLHELESSLLAITCSSKNEQMEDLKTLLNPVELKNWLQEELSILSTILGKDYLDKGNQITIDEEKLHNIEEKMKGILSEQQLIDLSPYIRKLRFKTIKDLLKQYPEYVQTIAERLNKFVDPVVIEGENLEVDPDKFHDFIKSLAHVFKNMVDHGIEDANDRLNNGKKDFGTIKCQVYSQTGYIVISISDDGAGISIDKLKQRAVELGIYEVDIIDTIPEAVLLDLIFTQGFSTNNSITEISGRGVGLFAVKYEIEQLNGSIQVFTKNGVGTEFRFLIPNK